MPFIGQQPLTGSYSKLDSITTSATATYNLQLGGAAYSPASANHLLVSLNGVMQAPQDSFTVSGSTITFASALTSSDNIDFIMALGDVLNIGTPSDGSVNISQLANSAVTTAKIADANVTTAKIADANVTTAKLANNSVTAIKKSVGVLQQVEVYHTSATQLTSAGAFHELSSSLRLAITPVSASSKLIFEVYAQYTSPNSNHLSFAKIYDVTNSAEVAQPPANGSRDRVHWSKRTTAFDINDMDTMNFSVTASSSNTNARTYTIYHRTEGKTDQFLSSTLSSVSGVTTPIHFRITEIL